MASQQEPPPHRKDSDVARHLRALQLAKQQELDALWAAIKAGEQIDAEAARQQIEERYNALMTQVRQEGGLHQASEGQMQPTMPPPIRKKPDDEQR